MDTNYTRVDITDARPGDEVWQAGRWTPVKEFILHGRNVTIVWQSGGTHTMPASIAPTVRRAERS